MWPKRKVILTAHTHTKTFRISTCSFDVSTTLCQQVAQENHLGSINRNRAPWIATLLWTVVESLIKRGLNDGELIEILEGLHRLWRLALYPTLDQTSVSTSDG